MSTTGSLRKNDGRDDLLALSADVMTSVAATATPAMTAREAARAICGLAGWVSHRQPRKILGMQERFAELVRHKDAWETHFRSLPQMADGRVDELVALIGCVCSSLLPLFGAGPLRSAMAFWATESDPAIWQTVAAA